MFHQEHEMRRSKKPMRTILWIGKRCWGRWQSCERSCVEQRQRLDCFDYPLERVPYAVTVVGRADWPQIITAMRQQPTTRFVFNVRSRCCPYQHQLCPSCGLFRRMTLPVLTCNSSFVFFKLINNMRSTVNM